ncbi:MULTISPECIES: glutamate--tRNA ligase [unclassified Oceanispirochaeta]|uniref:glutamate--tRNA ligase n=1 Tax=unclassified Oceanispirochaeta TaxID=2635722 RepID=UPI000E09BE84|nr:MULTISPECIES: glutamate--tRNA ligase [unclassified Oceanispirochaeta]MBF9014762.1 glutamate--tRNA ligase [Oceanispirochaeta sp. M2]NPD71018.1 glutamate--tRNA ligase [Oceanispirochaeta sp. M1]RDG33851.1 glutamate--tRNA ligase [Oceanispirochaeta sp. M1]
MSVRVRYAPSPTGLQHIGGVRTALFNYFYAKANGGSFILRIEDTDRERYSDESLQDLYDTLNWLDIPWDEGPGKGDFGPYQQSQRFDLYQEYAQKLIDDGKAYYCFCSTERLDQVREEQKKNKSKSQGYDRHCRDIDPAEALKRKDAGESCVIRLKVPLEGKTTFHDEVMGDISRKNADVSPDPIIVKTDGFPTYHLANVIDDHMMEITHIMRAQEWIPSGPLHVVLYEAFGWTPPKYCHLPLVMGKDGSKLSKRHGSTSLVDFRNSGYLPEAIINYISLLGWSFDDSREFFTREDLEKLFSMEKINKAPAVFDYKKLEWFNGQYIRKRSKESLLELLIPILQKDGVVSDPMTADETAILDGAFPLVQERLKFTTDVSETISFLYKDIESYNSEDALPKKVELSQIPAILDAAAEVLADFSSRTQEENEQAFYDKSQEMGLKMGQVMQPVRVAVTGTKISPPLFESIGLLGVEKAIQRIEALKEQIVKELG